MSDLIDLKSHSVNIVLNLLLKDRTTDKNIIFATDMYKDIDFTTAITKKLLLSASLEICPRVSKSLEEQTQRTRKKAEVFTPAWICNKMNNHCDTEWFGQENVFNIEQDHDWIPTTEKITFPKGKSWKDYVNSKRLEITCGEAPYIVSRYDMATGNRIPIEKRIGILDRKLRVINENVHTHKLWNQWVYRAFESVYGYEFQGDNLFIARINLLETFCEYTRDRWKTEPSDSSLKQIANIISWNLWQMDGIHGIIPCIGAVQEKEPYQMNLFEMMESIDTTEEKITKKLPETIDCNIYNWCDNKAIGYKSIREGKTMKFDVIIGNPPYQESDGGAGVSATPVYNKFIEAAKSLNPEVMDLIIPAKWYSGGKGLDQFRENMLNDSKISTLVDYTSSLDVFPGVDVAGGVCYFIRNENHEGECDFINYHNGIKTRAKRKLNEFSTFIRYPIAANIVKKILALNEDTLNNYVSSRKPFGLATKERPMASGDITLRYNGGTGPYKSSKIKVGNHMIDKWKVIISRLTAEHAGQPNKDGKFKVLSTIEILEPKVICSETYLVAGFFDTQIEAQNYIAYLKTKFVRFLLLQIAITQQVSRTTFSFIPVQDFLKAWTDEELYKKYKLSDEEIKFIGNMIKEME